MVWKTRIVCLIAAAVLATLAAPLSPAFVSAQEATPAPAVSDAPVFSVSPVEKYATVYASYELKPGDSASFSGRISVGGTQPASLEAFVGNAINPLNGGFAVATIDEPRTGAATWFTLDQTSFEIQPGQQQDIQLTATVPDGTEPGQYIVGLVVQTSQPIGDSSAGAFGLLQVIRSAMAIQITVPGEVESGFTLGDPVMENRNSISTLTAPIENTGNVLVKPAGSLSINSLDGGEIVTSPIEMGSIYMGNSSALQVVLPAQFAPGDYLVSISLEDAASGAKAEISNAPVTLTLAEDEPATFEFGLQVAPNGDPIRFADITVLVNNNGPAIPTATVNLHVFRDGEPFEVYPLAEKQAIEQGSSEISQRYIPAEDWEPGVYTFAVEIVAVDSQSGAETRIGTVESNDSITVDA